MGLQPADHRNRGAQHADGGAAASDVILWEDRAGSSDRRRRTHRHSRWADDRGADQRLGRMRQASLRM